MSRFNRLPEPTMQMKMIQRCPNCKKHLQLTLDGKCMECGQQINKEDLNKVRGGGNS